MPTARVLRHVLAALIPGHDTGLVPQVLTDWVARDALIISYYDGAGGPSRIAIVDRERGRYIKTLMLRSTGHVGGLGMTISGHLWVANRGKLVRYPASTLERGADGGTITADRTFDVPASSFAGVRGNDIWVGKFARSGTPRAYPYHVTGDGDLRSAGASFPVPTSTQGMVFAGGEIHVLYGSGSDEYADADDRVRTIHHAPARRLGGGG